MEMDQAFLLLLCFSSRKGDPIEGYRRCFGASPNAHETWSDPSPRFELYSKVNEVLRTRRDPEHSVCRQIADQMERARCKLPKVQKSSLLWHYTPQNVLAYPESDVAAGYKIGETVNVALIHQRR